MGCITLFCVIVAALVFTFVLIPAGCTGLAIFGTAKIAEQVEAAKIAVKAQEKRDAELARAMTDQDAKKPAPAPKAGPVSEIALALRARARWPMEVRTTRPVTLKMGLMGLETYDLQPKHTLTATAMGDDGTLTVDFRDGSATVSFTDTDFAQRVAALK